MKSLYFDIKDKEATKALIATTSYLERGGKSICNKNMYNIDYAEYHNIVNWISQMKDNTMRI